MVTTETEKVMTFFRGLDDKDAELALRHVDPALYVQHVVSATEDFTKLKERMSRYTGQDHRIRMIRNFQDGPCVFTQAEDSILGQNVFFDVFRFEGGAVVERWAYSDKAAPHVETATRRGKLSRSIDEIQLLLGQGDFVFITASGSIEGAPCTFVDLYRVEDDKIVEHWGFPEKL